MDPQICISNTLRCCLTMDHALDNAASSSCVRITSELAKNANAQACHPGPFNLDGPGNLKFKQAPTPNPIPSNSELHPLGNTLFLRYLDTFQLILSSLYSQQQAQRIGTRTQASHGPIRTEPQGLTGMLKTYSRYMGGFSGAVIGPVP